MSALYTLEVQTDKDVNEARAQIPVTFIPPNISDRAIRYHCVRVKLTQTWRFYEVDNTCSFNYLVDVSLVDSLEKVGTGLSCCFEQPRELRIFKSCKKLNRFQLLSWNNKCTKFSKLMVDEIYFHAWKVSTKLDTQIDLEKFGGKPVKQILTVYNLRNEYLIASQVAYYDYGNYRPSALALAAMIPRIKKSATEALLWAYELK